MKHITLAALFAFAALGPVASAATMTSTTTTSNATTSNATRAQMHTTNNVNRYSRATVQHLSRYQRNECIRLGGVIIKQKSNGQLVCLAKKR